MSYWKFVLYKEQGYFQLYTSQSRAQSSDPQTLLQKVINYGDPIWPYSTLPSWFSTRAKLKSNATCTRCCLDRCTSKWSVLQQSHQEGGKSQLLQHPTAAASEKSDHPGRCYIFAGVCRKSLWWRPRLRGPETDFLRHFVHLCER